MEDVYITRIAKYLPNDPVANEEMEGILGMVNGEPSRARPLVLVQNGIDTRYYVHNKHGEATHNNAQLAVAAIKNLTDDEFTLNDIELLCCGTTTPDQLVPSHASMVHGVLNNRPMEIVSPHGVCCSGMQAYKYGFLSVKAGNTRQHGFGDGLLFFESQSIPEGSGCVGGVEAAAGCTVRKGVPTLDAVGRCWRLSHGKSPTGGEIPACRVD